MEPANSLAMSSMHKFLPVEQPQIQERVVVITIVSLAGFAPVGTSCMTGWYCSLGTIPESTGPIPVKEARCTL